MAGLITDLSAIGAIDRTADLLEIVDVSANGSFSVTPNNLVGISGGSVVSTTDSQTIQNKIFDNTNALTIKDGSLTLQNTSSVTKQATFSLASVTAGQTRVLTVPDANLVIVGTTTTQTLTNKTLTSPTITGGTIDNATVTVDTVSGHTNANIVTIAGLQISSGVVGTNGVATASIADTAVTPAKLQSGTGSGWGWSSWVPSWTNLSVGNGVLGYAKYIQTGKTVMGRLYFTFGTTTSVSAGITFSLPINLHADYADFTYRFMSNVDMRDASASTTILGLLTVTSASTVALQTTVASGTATSIANTSATVPYTWATSDIISCSFMYEGI